MNFLVRLTTESALRSLSTHGMMEAIRRFIHHKTFLESSTFNKLQKKSFLEALSSGTKPHSKFFMVFIEHKLKNYLQSDARKLPRGAGP